MAIWCTITGTWKSEFLFPKELRVPVRTSQRKHSGHVHGPRRGGELEQHLTDYGVHLRHTGALNLGRAAPGPGVLGVPRPAAPGGHAVADAGPTARFDSAGDAS